MELTVFEAIADSLPVTMEFTCQTYSYKDQYIEPRVNGYIKSIHYQEGMPVKEGQLLIIIEPSEFEANVAAAEASLASAQAQKVQAQDTYDRYVPLARMSAISRSSLDAATASLAEAIASVNSSKASLRNAKLNLSYCFITAPTDGIIGQNSANIGSYVGSGTKYTTLNTVSNIDSIYVYLSIPTSRYLTIASNDSLGTLLYNDGAAFWNIELTTADGKLFPHKGKYAFTERALNNQTGSIVVHIIFPNPQHSLKSGEFVKVKSNIGKKRPTIIVPQRSVIQTQGLNSVFVVDNNGTVTHRSVILGDTYGTMWEIRTGLNPGEMVLTEGLQKVRSGQKIKPIKN